MLLSLVLACGGGGEATDTAPATVFPTSTEVLFYEGHGGETGRTLGEGVFSQAFERIASWGYAVVEEEDALGDPSAYRAVFLVDPGVHGAIVFNYDEVQSLLGALAAGTRIVILASLDNCEGLSINRLLDDLEVGMQLAPGPHQPYDVVDIEVQVDSQLTRDVERVYLRDPCEVTVDGAEAILYVEREVYLAAQRVGHGGDVVLVGDYNFMDDTELLDDVDNEQLLRNLVEVGP